MTQNTKSGGGRVVGRLLPAAVKLWLRSQVQQIENLSIDLAGRDRQLISGYLPGVSVAAQQAIYQGIHITQVQLSAKDIRINIGQVIRGKPLRLLKAFPVQGETALSSEDLNASLASPLLAEGLTNFWRSLTQQPEVSQAVNNQYGLLPLADEAKLHQPQIRLGAGCLGLSFYPMTPAETGERPVILGVELSVVSGHILQLSSARWLSHLDELSQRDKGTPVDALEEFHWDLGRDVQLSLLKLQPSQLLCSGEIMVNP